MVVIDPAEYWQLRAVTYATGAAERDVMTAGAALEEARRVHAAMVARVVEKYRLDAGTKYLWDDAACGLQAAADGQ